MKTSDTRVGLVKFSALPKKAALYTMKTSSEQRLTLPSHPALPLLYPAGVEGVRLSNHYASHH